MKIAHSIGIYLACVLININIYSTEYVSNDTCPDEVLEKVSTNTWYAYYYDAGQTLALKVLDLSTNTVVNSDAIALPGPSATCFGLAITPDRNKVLLSNINGAVFSVETITGILLNELSIATTQFAGLAITPDGTKGYINGVGDSQVVLDLSAHVFLPINPILSGFSVAVTPDGKKVYTTQATTLNVLDIASGTSTTIPVGGTVQRIAITPNGKFAYITLRTTNDVRIIDIATDTLVGAPIPISGLPFNIAITADGTRAFVVSDSSGFVTAIDLSTNTIIGAPIPIVGTPRGIAITPDSKTAYLSNLNGLIIPIDVATLTLGTPITAGTNIQEIAITPDQAPTALFKVKRRKARNPNLFVFDASASFSPVGSIANYFWDFGDGHTLNTTSPIVKHTYSKRIPKTVTLIVTNTAGTSTDQVFTGQTMSKNGGSSAIFTREINCNKWCNGILK